jgi:arylsulfatase A-like enzyme
MTSRSIWRWAIWFGLLTGLVEAALVTSARAATNRLIFMTSDVGWMAPLVDVLAFVIAAAMLLPIWKRLQEGGLTVTLAIFLWLSLIGPALLVSSVHVFAIGVLSAGVAMQGARMLVRRLRWLELVTRRTTPVLVAIVALLGIRLYASREMTAHRALASAVRADGHANVILLVMDTVRAENLDLYGYARPTSPALDGVAARGTTFDRALSTSSWTLPSHASMFTGRFPHELSADWRTPLDGRHRTLAEVLRQSGYLTAGFVGNLLYTPAETGLARGFSHYEDYPVSAPVAIWSSWLTRSLIQPLRHATSEDDRFVRKDAAEVNEEFLGWLDAVPREKPFFAFLNYFDAHSPYIPPAPFDTMFGAGGAQPDGLVRRQWSKQEIQRSMDAYDGALAHIDHEVGRLLVQLNERQLLDRTLIIVTSDHGEQFGEHGLFDHANSLYRQTLQVPLVVSLPGRIPSGRRVSAPVTLADLAATILDVAGVNQEPRLPGTSLARHWQENHPAAEPSSALLSEVSKGINTPPWVPITKGALKSVVTDRMHYIQHADGQEELFDFEHDPAETEDLVGRSEAADLLKRSRRALNHVLNRED